MKFNSVQEYQDWLKSREVVQPKAEPKKKPSPRPRKNTTKAKKED